MLNPTMLPQRVLRALIRVWARRKNVEVLIDSDRIDIVTGNRTIRLAGGHLIYVPFLVNAFDTFWDYVKDDNGLLDFSGPRRHTYRSTGDAYWFPSIPEEPDALNGYFHWNRPTLGQTVYDIGAYGGATACQLANMVGPTGRVIAFEPDPSAFRCLERNIEEHGLTHITAVRCAVGGTTSQRQFNIDGTMGAAFSDTLERHGTVPTDMVDCITFVDACERYGVPSFVKIDIEGAEVELLEAAVPYLATQEIAFALDTNHKIGGWLGPALTGEFTSAAVEAAFHKAGYDALTSADYGYRTTWARPSQWQSTQR
jgi:FkbM family methyltransferase